MSVGSRDDSSSAESDEDESESSSSSSINQPVSLLPVGMTAEQGTLKAVFHKWTLHAATDLTDTETDPVLQHPSNQLPDTMDQDNPLHRSRITTLPYEVLLNIFRWAVGSHLDTRILGRLAQVCRGFYLLSCDPYLWRPVCFRQWPSLFGGETESSLHDSTPQTYGFVSWKDMAIRRPHVLLDGCYLCRITYVRAGESQFNDFCRQLHLVVYYRGIRFYPDGRMCMLTSAYPPNAIVAALGNMQDTDSPAAMVEQDSSTGFMHSGLLKGTYKWCDPEFVVCTLFRPRCKDKTQPLRRLRRLPDSQTQLTFNIRFRLASSKRRLHSILHWDSYVIHTRNLSTQSDHSTTLNVSSDQFPSCHFSVVRSYTSEVAPQPL